jgi:hypothetical protein
MYSTIFIGNYHFSYLLNIYLLNLVTRYGRAVAIGEQSLWESCTRDLLSQYEEITQLEHLRHAAHHDRCRHTDNTSSLT